MPLTAGEGPAKGFFARRGFFALGSSGAVANRGLCLSSATDAANKCFLPGEECNGDGGSVSASWMICTILRMCSSFPLPDAKSDVAAVADKGRRATGEAERKRVGDGVGLQPEIGWELDSTASPSTASMGSTVQVLVRREVRYGVRRNLRACGYHSHVVLHAVTCHVIMHHRVRLPFPRGSANGTERHE